MKDCKTCHVAKFSDDFYFCKSTKDKLSPECKECTRKRTKSNTQKKIDEDPGWVNKRRDYVRKWYQENGTSYKPSAEKERARSLERSRLFPEKKKARTA